MASNPSKLNNVYNPYTKLANFGHIANVLKTDPVGYSIYRDIDSFFDIGPNAADYGPSAEKSHLYMSERCSKNWDGACELMSRNEEQARSNVGGVLSSSLYARPPPSDLSIGDVLVENTAVRRFCDLSTCSVDKESFNPNDPTSPMISKYGGKNCYECQPVCMPPSNPDDDIVLNKVLDYPEKHVDLLLNMYRSVSKKGKRNDYKNTRIDMVFSIFDKFVKKK
jgi:hypothetical protein